MAFNPEETVTLTNHGTMKLRSAVARAMMLPPNERKRATIVRDSNPATLRFDQIKDLAARWEKQLVPDFSDLEKQMQDLRALRRALCLAMARRGRPMGARRKALLNSNKRRSSHPVTN